MNSERPEAWELPGLQEASASPWPVSVAPEVPSLEFSGRLTVLRMRSLQGRRPGVGAVSCFQEGLGPSTGEKWGPRPVSCRKRSPQPSPDARPELLPPRSGAVSGVHPKPLAPVCCAQIPSPQTRAEAPGAVAVHHCVSLLCSLLHRTQRLPVLLRVGPQSSHPRQDQEGGQGPAG